MIMMGDGLEEFFPETESILLLFVSTIHIVLYNY
jgi:hypothetical protein